MRVGFATEPPPNLLPFCFVGEMSIPPISHVSVFFWTLKVSRVTGESETELGHVISHMVPLFNVRSEGCGSRTFLSSL